MPYICPKCKKVYQKNGKWLRKHLIETCHVKSLNPIELVEKQDDKLDNILYRINSLESMIRNIKTTTVKYHDTPIERIKQEEANKIVDPLLEQYRKEFGQCIKDLKEMIKKGVELEKPQAYKPEVTEEMAFKKLQEINKKNAKRRELYGNQLTILTIVRE